MDRWGNSALFNFNSGELVVITPPFICPDQNKKIIKKSDIKIVPTHWPVMKEKKMSTSSKVCCESFFY
jgi:hypothetical protein